MFRPLFFISSLLTSSLFANQIIVRATVASHANAQMKVTHKDVSNIKQDVFLDTNQKGLTIALTDSSYSGTYRLNNHSLGISPMNFSDKIYTKSTKVAELIISQKENRGSLGVTIAVK